MSQATKEPRGVKGGIPVYETQPKTYQTYEFPSQPERPYVIGKKEPSKADVTLIVTPTSARREVMQQSIRERRAEFLSHYESGSEKLSQVTEMLPFVHGKLNALEEELLVLGYKQHGYELVGKTPTEQGIEYVFEPIGAKQIDSDSYTRTLYLPTEPWRWIPFAEDITAWFGVPKSGHESVPLLKVEYPRVYEDIALGVVGGIALGYGVYSFAKTVSPYVSSGIGKLEQQLTPEHYYYYKYIAEKPMITTMIKESFPFTEQLSILKGEISAFKQVVLPSMIQTVKQQAAPITYAFSVVKGGASFLRQTTEFKFPSLNLPIPTETKAYFQVAKGKTKYALGIGEGINKTPLSELWQPKEVIEFPTQQITQYSGSTQTVLTQQFPVSEGIKESLALELMQTYPTVLHIWKGLEYPSGRQRKQVKLRTYQEEYEFLTSGITSLEIVKLQPLTKPKLDLNVKTSLAFFGLSTSGLSLEQESMQLQKQSQSLRQTQATRILEVSEPKYQNLFEEPRRRKGKRKADLFFGFYGRYPRTYPLATPKRVLKLFVGS